MPVLLFSPSTARQNNNNSCSKINTRFSCSPAHFSCLQQRHHTSIHTCPRGRSSPKPGVAVVALLMFSLNVRVTSGWCILLNRPLRQTTTENITTSQSLIHPLLLETTMAVAMSSTCPGLYCGRVMVNGTVVGECGVCPRGERANLQKVCERCTESPELYDWLYLGFMAMLPLVLHWFFIEWYSGKKSSSALLQHITAMLECSVSAVVTLLVTEPVGQLSICSCRVQMLSDWYTMLYNPSPDYVNTLHCTQEAVYPLYTIVLIYYAFCLVLMMLLRPLLVKKIACGLGKSDRFKSIYAALYFFPILTVLQAVGGGLLYYAFPYIILVLSLVTLAVYMSASEIQSFKNLVAKKKRLVVLFSHWLLHAYGIISISRLDKLEQDLPLLALVPGPALFYIATAKFTEPSRILSEGGNGH